MKNKDLLITIILFILFIIMIFLSPFVENKTAGTFWSLFFIAITVSVILWVVKKLITSKPTETFKKQPKILQILIILCIISMIYDFINLGSGIYISVIVVGISIIIEFCMWFFKKEE